MTTSSAPERIRVFCFPFAGGGATLYRQWAPALSSTSELAFLHFPGREQRISEDPVRDLSCLVVSIVTAISPYLDLPFVFFGHSFGALVAFGLGGIHVEIFKDVHVRLAPLTDRDVDDLIHSVKGFPLLQGYRGHAAADIDALRDALLRLSRLADEVPEIAELDLNPVIALPPGDGCRIVDARIRVADAPPPFERVRHRT